MFEWHKTVVTFYKISLLLKEYSRFSICGMLWKIDSALKLYGMHTSCLFNLDYSFIKVLYCFICIIKAPHLELMRARAFSACVSHRSVKTSISRLSWSHSSRFGLPNKPTIYKSNLRFKLTECCFSWKSISHVISELQWFYRVVCHKA